MKLKAIFALALTLAAFAPGLRAQAPDLTGEAPDLTGKTDVVAVETVPYINSEYSGFRFELPAGSIIEKGENLVAKYPDGSFGVSMINVARPSKQKIALEVCRRNAADMRLKNARVEKVKYGDASGAKATGELEGQHVTILVLPYGNREFTTVILATPSRTEWVDHFLETLRKR